MADFAIPNRALGTNLGHVFDPLLFIRMWQTQPDPTLTAFYNSGVLVNNQTIANTLALGGSTFTMPVYDLITGEPAIIDGRTDVPIERTTSGQQRGVVAGFSQGWRVNDFQDILSGVRIMSEQILPQVVSFWAHFRQKWLLGMVDALMDIPDANIPAKWSGEWAKHTTNIASTTSNITEANRFGPGTLPQSINAAVGDNSRIFTLIVMHSAVATNLAVQQILQFWTQTDANGLQRPTNMASLNGLTVIVDDGVTTKLNPVSGALEYHTYVFGRGAIQTADARLLYGAEPHREPIKEGGIDFIITRIRESYHLNGTIFSPPLTADGQFDWTETATKQMMWDPNNYKLIFNPKAVPLAKIISNG